MVTINSAGAVDCKLGNISARLTQSQLELLKETLAENDLSVDDFAHRKNSCLVIVDENHLVPAIVKDLAGLRLTVLTYSKTDFSVFNEHVWQNLETIGSFLQADLIQLLVPPNVKVAIREVPSVVLENFVFEKSTEEFGSSPYESIGDLKFETEYDQIPLAELEFLTRLKFPSSSYRPKDRIVDLVAEYSTFTNSTDIAGLCVEGHPQLGFVIWWKDVIKRSAIVIHLWVPPKSRGKGLGTMLLNSMNQSLNSQGIEKIRYFVSAANVDAIKTLFKAEFNLKYFVLNRMIAK